MAVRRKTRATGKLEGNSIRLNYYKSFYNGKFQFQFRYSSKMLRCKSFDKRRAGYAIFSRESRAKKISTMGSQIQTVSNRTTHSGKLTEGNKATSVPANLPAARFKSASGIPVDD